MPIPLAVGRWNRAGFNRISTPVARYLPGFAVVHHRGRRTGREYRTPVSLFTVGDRFVIALAYGPRTDWVRNVLAAGGCTIETRGALVACGRPQVYRDAERHGIRPVERAAFGLLDVQDFLELVRSP